PAGNKTKTPLTESPTCCWRQRRWSWISRPIVRKRSCRALEVLMNNPVTITFAGRSFSAAELALMRQAVHDYAPFGLTEIARTICEWLDWKRPSGRLKNHECRQLLERLEQLGVLTLPELRC